MAHVESYALLKAITGTVMIKVLKDLLDTISREHAAKKPTPVLTPTRSYTGGDFRAVDIVPSSMCCAAATRATRRPYLLCEAPRLPLPACTMPLNCSCKFRKNADRRNSDRRVFAAQTNRLFAGFESRKRGGRRVVEK
jgi:hypothetical protein